MDLDTAMEVAESMGLSDGAYFAVVAELMGVEQEEMFDQLAAQAKDCSATCG